MESSMIWEAGHLFSSAWQGCWAGAAACLGDCPPGSPLPFQVPAGFPVHSAAQAPEPEPPEKGLSLQVVLKGSGRAQEAQA